jgi:hypothetical protein
LKLLSRNVASENKNQGHDIMEHPRQVSNTLGPNLSFHLHLFIHQPLRSRRRISEKSRNISNTRRNSRSVALDNAIAEDVLRGQRDQISSLAVDNLFLVTRIGHRRQSQ